MDIISADVVHVEFGEKMALEIPNPHSVEFGVMNNFHNNNLVRSQINVL